MNRTFQQSYYIGGALSGNHTLLFAAHTNLTLLHVSAVNTSSHAGTLKIGAPADDDAYMQAAGIGVNSNPARFRRDSFVNRQPPRISNGDVVKITITDHASHMANVTLVLTFAEG